MRGSNMELTLKPKSIYEFIVEKANDTTHIRFDLIGKKIRYNNKNIVDYDFDTGEVFIENELSNIPLITKDEVGENWKETIKKLYFEHYYSVPSINNIPSPFVAKHVDDLSYEDMLLGENRNVTSAKLQALLILGSLTGLIQWEDNDKHYWYSDKLYVYRNWISLQENKFKLKEKKYE